MLFVWKLNQEWEVLKAKMTVMSQSKVFGFNVMKCTVRSPMKSGTGRGKKQQVVEMRWQATI